MDVVAVPADVAAAVAALRIASHLEGTREYIPALIGDGEGQPAREEWDIDRAVAFVTDAEDVIWVRDALAGHHLAASPDGTSVVQFDVPVPDGVEFPDEGSTTCHACASGEGHRPDEFVEFVETQAKPRLAAQGWVVQGCMPPPGVDDAPGFFYTIGMIPAGLPELLVVGMSVNQTAAVIQAAVDRHLKDEIRPGDELTFDELGEVPFRFVEVPPDTATRLLTVAQAALPGSEIRALQVMWQDPNGRWPDDPESVFNDMVFTADEVLAAAQRIRP